MEKKPTYTGRISGAGRQYVEAPVKPSCTKGKTIKHRGTDLRNGK